MAKGNGGVRAVLARTLWNIAHAQSAARSKSSQTLGAAPPSPVACRLNGNTPPPEPSFQAMGRDVIREHAQTERLRLIMPATAKVSFTQPIAPTRKSAVLVVDDHPLFRRGVVQLLQDEPDLEVRAEASTSNEALEALRKQKFDLAVVDIGLEGSTNGIELTKY